ncbi:unnamed protein product, partial [Didymodactylos carnosus]
FTNNDYQQSPDEIKSNIEAITELLNELKIIEPILSQQSTASLEEVCKHLEIKSPILSMLPNEIKCENYLPVIILLIKQRTKLQEQLIIFEEKEIKTVNCQLWNEGFVDDKEQSSVEKQDLSINRFQDYLTNECPEHQHKTTTNSTETIFNRLDVDDNKYYRVFGFSDVQINETTTQGWIMEENVVLLNNFQEKELSHTELTRTDDDDNNTWESIDYTLFQDSENNNYSRVATMSSSVFELRLKLVDLSSCNLIPK